MNKTLWDRIFGCRCTTRMWSLLWVQLYSRSSPCDHSRKRPALVTTTFVKPRLNCDVNFVMKSSRKRPLQYWPWPLFGLPSWTFILILCSRKRPLSLSHINQNFNETALCVNSLKILVIKRFSPVYTRCKDTHWPLLIWRRGYKVVWREADILGVWVRGALKNRWRQGGGGKIWL